MESTIWMMILAAGWMLGMLLALGLIELFLRSKKSAERPWTTPAAHDDEVESDWIGWDQLTASHLGRSNALGPPAERI